MNDPTRLIADMVRTLMAKLAHLIDKVSGGSIKPVHITILSFLGHIPAAWALATGQIYAAVYLIIVFGLMDALDGALAREQQTVSKMGMYFDAVTDRMKEIILYSALSIYAVSYTSDIPPWIVVAVAGTSVLVSYVKAKGEMAISDNGENVQKLNRMFDGGIARYEIRMALLVIGLLTGILGPLLRLIIALNLITISIRFMQASQLIVDQEAHIKKEQEAALNNQHKTARASHLKKGKKEL